MVKGAYLVEVCVFLAFWRGLTWKRTEENGGGWEAGGFRCNQEWNPV